MTKFIFSLLALSLLLFIIKNKEVSATREKRDIWGSIKQLKITPDDPLIQPSIFCDKTIPNCTPTLRPPPSVDALAKAKSMRNALRSFGTNEKTIIEILTKHGIIQRLEIAKVYPSINYRLAKSKNMLNNLRSDTKGSFQDTLTALMTALPILFAKELHKTMIGAGPKENTLVEILGTVPNAAVKSIAHFYHELFTDTSLENDIKVHTNGNFQKLMVLIVQGKRDTNPTVDTAKVTADAQALVKSGETGWKADATGLNDILATRTHIHLKQTLDEYQKSSGHSIEEDIKKAFSENDQIGMLAVVKSIQNKPKFIAEQLEWTLKDAQVRDSDLIRIIVSRNEIDLGDVKAAYKAAYGRTLESKVSSKIGSEYRDTLLNYINGNVAEPSEAPKPEGSEAPKPEGSEAPKPEESEAPPPEERK